MKNRNNNKYFNDGLNRLTNSDHTAKVHMLIKATYYLLITNGIKGVSSQYGEWKLKAYFVFLNYYR